MAEERFRRSVGPAGTSKLLGLAAFVASALVAGWLGSIAISAAAPTWYSALAKPGFMPPDAVFGVVWTVLYVVMGVAAWLVWLEPGSVGRNAALTAYFVQLALNAVWVWAFFGAQSTGLGLTAIVALFLAVAWTVNCFTRGQLTGGDIVPALPRLGRLGGRAEHSLVPPQLEHDAILDLGDQRADLAVDLPSDRPRQGAMASQDIVSPKTPRFPRHNPLNSIFRIPEFFIGLG